jgi:hypothetical protein
LLEQSRAIGVTAPPSAKLQEAKSGGMKAERTEAAAAKNECIPNIAPIAHVRVEVARNKAGAAKWKRPRKKRTGESDASVVQYKGG